MGCATSKQQALAEPIKAAQVTDSGADVPTSEPAFGADVDAQQQQQPEKPKPMVFAIMRNGHEVLRGNLRDMTAALQESNTASFAEQWANFLRWGKIHAAMEDGVPGGVGVDEEGTPLGRGMFAMMDREADNAASDGGLREEHEKVEEKEHAVQDALRRGAGVDELRAAYAAFAELYEAHMKTEESIMMPQVQAFAKKGFDLKKGVRQCLWPAIPAGEEGFFITFAMQILEKHPEGMPRARVFAHAVWAVSTEEEWTSRHAAVKEGLSPELYAKIAGECGF